MKKGLMSIAAMMGIVSSASAANLAATDAEFMFGASNVDAIAMTGAEMVQTQGQLLEILDPVLALVVGLPIVGPLLGGLLNTVLGLVGNLPIVGGLLGGLL